MTRLLVIILLICSLGGCGNSKTIDGVTYDTDGLLDKDERNPCIQYIPIKGNIFWGVILVETVIVPIAILGFDMYEPVGKKNTPECTKSK